jgi:lipoprotein-anchoring transpeptidase ErfK/SrfK
MKFKSPFAIGIVVLIIVLGFLLVSLASRPKGVQAKGKVLVASPQGPAAFPANTPVAASAVPAASQPASKTMDNLLEQAKKAEETGELLDAQRLYRQWIVEFSSQPQVAQVQKRLEDVNMKIVFSGLTTKDTAVYEVKPGDSLYKIAKQYNVTVEFIMKSNSLSSEVIRPQMKLRIWTGKFSCIVDKSQNTLTLKSNDEIIKTYHVSTGVNNSTPVGKFKVVTKIVNPVWYKAGAVVPAGSPENILGSRWLGFDKTGYGIHGTTEPETIGQQVTQGCVRMRNEDVEELFTLLPSGTEITVID